MFVSCVHPVAMRSAVFCMVWSFCVLVSDIIGDHTVFVYSSIGLVIVLYVVSSVSFVLPQCAEVSALRMFNVGFAFATVLCMCCE